MYYIDVYGSHASISIYKKYPYRKLDTAKDLWKNNISSKTKALVLLNLSLKEEILHRNSATVWGRFWTWQYFVLPILCSEEVRWWSTGRLCWFTSRCQQKDATIHSHDYWVWNAYSRVRVTALAIRPMSLQLSPWKKKNTRQKDTKYFHCVNTELFLIQEVL